MKVYLRTFGCRANQYDTETVRAMVEDSGHEIVAHAADADIAVFNSCAVTADAEAELRKTVRRAARERPALRSVVMGCASALDDARPVALRIGSLPSVERVVAGADFTEVASALDLDPARAGVRARAQSGTRALLRIQDGCDEHCTFCATTMARGSNRSRSVTELVVEAQQLAARHAEIVITGIHIGSYGADTGTSLAALTTELVRAVPSVRFRLSSIEATELDEPLIELLLGAPLHLAPHIHAPLQSGSDAVLKRMGRHWYTSETYSAALERIAALTSVLGLGADVIAGFPGETEADHARTLALVDRLPFTYLHVFPYSVRPGTAAERLPGRVNEGTAQRRAADLREVAARKSAAYLQSRHGGLADIVVLGGRDAREGMTGDYLTVTPSDSSLARGARFTGRLSVEPGRIVALSSDR